MQRDINTREDIVLLVNTFYNKVKTDPQLGYIFDGVAKIDWDIHLPKMYDFWESILFGVAKFKGNPMEVHFTLHQKHQLTRDDFSIWIRLFNETIDELFEGEMADQARQKANAIAELMHFKLTTKTHGIQIRNQ